MTTHALRVPILWLLWALALAGLPSCGEKDPAADGDREASSDGDRIEAESEPEPDAEISDREEAEAEEEEPRFFTFAILADPHIIDEYYTGPEGSPLDTETIWHTRENLEYARGQINAMTPLPDLVLVAGDIIHNLPSDDPEFYQTHVTRFDHAAEIFSQFAMPVHLAYGNHDYDTDQLDRETTHALFRQKLNTEPYHVVDHKGFRFILLNNFLGAEEGTLGAAQLEWLEGLLSEGRPTLLVLHFPVSQIAEEEEGRPGLKALLETYDANVRLVASGHLHFWWHVAEKQWVIGSTRYDPNAVMFLEADRETGTIRILNEDCLKVMSRETIPYDPQNGCTEAER